MKKIILLFIFFLCAKSFAQTNGITYQALILNPTEGKVSTATNTNSPLVSKDICMLFKFVDEFSNVEYQEVIRTKTDPYGMVNLIIGTGTQTAGYSTSFDKISWDSVQKNLVVEISFTGDCSSFTEISNQPFSSVPFAYSSINAVNVTGVVALENGGTNATTVIGAKTNLGLENVDNTTDLNKPISTASKLALNLKEDTINKSTNVITDGNSDIKYPTVKSVKNYVDSSVSFNLSGLTNEISRATTAENTIAANLVSETERATLEEATLSANLTAETTRATLAENTLTTNLTAETTRATAAEVTKEDTVNKSTDGSFTSNSDVKFPTEKATKTYVDASASSNSLALTNEISRATTAENTLTTNLTAEVNRATTAEATKEDAANKSTDGSFTSNSDVKFPTEKATKTYVDASASSNSLALTNEISRATLAENTIAANLVSETVRATLEETTLTTNLTAEVNRATTAEATKEDAANKSTDGSFTSNSDVKFPTEKATKTYVDASASYNSMALNNEISRATLAENTIAANLVSENERATLAEATNATALTAETNRATLAETTLTTNLTAEVNRATTAEATKEDTANKSTDGSFASNSDVKFPTEKATKTYVDARASSNSLALTNEISRATLEENIIAANLVLETERATSAEATNATAINAETTRATLAETTNATAITTEVNRATIAEATKENAANKSTDGSFATNSDVKFPTEKATKTYVDASTSSNSSSLATEVNRATTAEGTLSTNLASEASTRAAADVVLTNDLAAEVSRSTVAEGVLTTNLATEVTDRTNADLLKEDKSNKSVSLTTDGASDTKYPSVKSVKDYVDGEINTSETDTQTALNLKANVASPTFTGTVSGIDKTMVGLSNVDDTTDANKPVSIATQTALDLKANLVSPTLTGIPTAPTADSGTNTNQLATTAFVTAVASSSNFVDLTTDQTVAGTKTFSSTVTGNSFVKSGGTSAQYLMADGSVSNGTAPVREEADEFSAMASQTSFTLTQTPSTNSKVKMFVNGIRISKTAYRWDGATLTYDSSKNGGYDLSVNDRIQFDYFY